MVGHRDRAQAPVACGREQHLHRRGAVVGVVGVHVQVDVDQRPPGQARAQLGVALAVAGARQLAVDRLSWSGGVAPVGRAAYSTPATLPRHRATAARSGTSAVLARERAGHQLRRGRQARGARVQAPEEALHEAARQQRREQPLGGRVERADVQRARVAQRRVGRARRERLVHVHEVQLDRAQQFLDRPRHVDRQGHRTAMDAIAVRPAPPRGSIGAGPARHVEHLADGDHPRARRSSVPSSSRSGVPLDAPRAARGVRPGPAPASATAPGSARGARAARAPARPLEHGR